MTKIVSLDAMEILDSRGYPTLSVKATLTDGRTGISAVPSGTSSGKREALELRDGDGSRFGGKGVLKAVEHVHNELSRLVIGLNAEDQSALDQTMIEADGTPNKGRLGANAILAVSLAVLHATCDGEIVGLSQRFAHLTGAGEPTELPLPLFNILNGGAHAADSTDFQEFMVAPVGMGSFSAALQAGAEIYQSLGSILKDEELSTNVGFEGGFAPQGLSNRQALAFVVRAIENAGYTPGKDVFIALDSAASEFYDTESNMYNLEKDGRILDSAGMIEEYESLCREFPIFSIEDGMSEDDWSGWSSLVKVCGGRIQLVGDDLFATQRYFIERGIREKAANAVLVKFNQVGTVTETLDAMKTARSSGMRIVISHRSGETEDTTIADMAVGTRAGQIKAGAPSRGERTAKYNRLLRLERELGENAEYAGKAWR